MPDALGDELADDLLHVAYGLLGHVRHDERAVVQALERLLLDDPDERRRGHVAELRVDGAEHRGRVHEDLVGREREERPAGHGVVRDEHGHLGRVRLRA